MVLRSPIYGVHHAAAPCSPPMRSTHAVRRTLFLIEKLMKLVSTSTWYGGPSCVLYLKKSADETFSTRRTLASCFLCCCLSLGPPLWPWRRWWSVLRARARVLCCGEEVAVRRRARSGERRGGGKARCKLLGREGAG